MPQYPISVSLNQKKSRGFTMIEIMILILLLALTTTIGVRLYWHWVDTHAFDKATQDILRIKNGMMLYKLDNGFYPSTEQGIAALVAKPSTNPIPEHWIQYLKTIPIDDSGRPYHYVNPGHGKNIQIFRGS